MTVHPSILLIDDSPGECELFGLALEQAHLAVSLHTEPDAEIAWQFLTQLPSQASLPSLILIDLQLSGQHGCDLLTRLRADARFAHLPVVIFTTSADPSDVARGYAAGANGYVVKPGTFTDLIHCAGDICRYWVDRNRVPSMVETRC